MRSPWKLVLFVFLFAPGCDKSTDPESDSVPNEVVGTWIAKQFVYTNKANASQSVDVLGLGISFTLTIQSNGNFTARTTIPQGGTETDTGTITFSGNQVTVKSEEETSTLTYSVSGNTLTITSEDESFDFNGDGIDEPATMRIVLEKS